MCRSGDSGAPSRSRGLRVGASALLLCLLVPCSGAWAQGGEPFLLESQTRLELAKLQDSWIEWLASAQQEDEERSAILVDLLKAQVEALGMENLPDLATAAAVLAASFAANSEFEKAKIALAAAESLQPGSPEAAFAAVALAREQGDRLVALAWLGKGVVRIFFSSPWARVALGNVFLWMLLTLTLSAFAFVGLMMASHGGLLFQDLTDFLTRSLPASAAYVLVVAILTWPMVLPAGILWLGVYWSVLLWGYGSLREQIALILLWVFIGGLPFMVSGNTRRIDVAMSAPMQAIENASEGRLSGSLFTDLGIAIELLPDSAAMKHFQADMHLRLGQWSMARRHLQEVLAIENGNLAALSDLGVAAFHEGDVESAVLYLRQAAEAERAPAQVFFNLGRAFSEQYRFEESEAMMERANVLDRRAVGRWIAMGDLDRAVTVSGGLLRRREVEEQLRSVWRDVEGERIAIWRRVLSVPLALVLLGPAVGIYFLARRRKREVAAVRQAWFEGKVERLRAALIPGLVEVEQRRPDRGWLALIAALILGTLPFWSSFGVTVPLGYDRSLSAASFVGVLGLAVFVGIRWLRFESAKREPRT